MLLSFIQYILSIKYFIFSEVQSDRASLQLFLAGSGLLRIHLRCMFCYTPGRNYSTRLETRTKEFNWIASRRVLLETLLYFSRDIYGEAKATLCHVISFRDYCSTGWLSICVELLRINKFASCEFIINQAKEQFSWDPKDGELCSDMVKPGENLVEACVVRNWRANRCRLTWV